MPLDISFGDAAISNKHYNFLVNKGNATFNDMKNLVEYIQKNVKSKTGVSLEPEIEIVD